MKKLGIFGGSFNPPHLGHIKAAEYFNEQLKLDKLIIVPSGNSPHKNADLAPAIDRYNMTKLAFRAFSSFEISNYETNKSDISYSVNTIEHFKNIYKDYDIYFYMSSDMIFTLSSWFNPEKIAKSCIIACGVRNKEDTMKLKENCKVLKDKFGFEFVFVDFLPIVISSTQIRNDVKNYKYLSEDVKEYIIKEELYK